MHMSPLRPRSDGLPSGRWKTMLGRKQYFTQTVHSHLFKHKIHSEHTLRKLVEVTN